MSSIWTFSSSSKELVEKCIAAAKSPDENNKWIQRFGHKNYIESNINPTDSKKNLVIPTPENSTPNKKVEYPKIEQFEEFLESIENEPVLRFDQLVSECLKENVLLSHLANKLSNSAIEKLINHIYEKNDLDSRFIEKFHTFFVPCLLRKEHSWLTLDVLIKSHKFYPKAFEMLLKIIIKDNEISNNVLQDLIENFNEKELSNVIMVITDLELSSEEFTHNMFNIYTAYKRCKKTNEIQKSIFTIMSQHAQVFPTDKNYGKLLLIFLQTEKDMKSLSDYGNLEKIIETHRSPFKRPCVNLLNDLMEELNVSDSSSIDSEII